MLLLLLLVEVLIIVFVLRYIALTIHLLEIDLRLIDFTAGGRTCGIASERDRRGVP